MIKWTWFLVYGNYMSSLKSLVSDGALERKMFACFKGEKKLNSPFKFSQASTNEAKENSVAFGISQSEMVWPQGRMIMLKCGENNPPV